MAEIVNLRQARKAKARTEAAVQADANRARHGVSKGERELANARAVKAGRDAEARRLDDES
jgi:hypothetical protein